VNKSRISILCIGLISNITSWFAWSMFMRSYLILIFLQRKVPGLNICICDFLQNLKQWVISYIISCRGGCNTRIRLKSAGPMVRISPLGAFHFYVRTEGVVIRHTPLGWDLPALPILGHGPSIENVARKLVSFDKFAGNGKTLVFG
jgi:hypothetical protein